MSTPFTLWQNHVAIDLGISEQELRERRDCFLAEGLHFQKKGPRKLYSIAGMDRLRETLSHSLPDIAPAPEAARPATSSEKTPRPPDAAIAEEIGGLKEQFVTLKVWRSWPRIRNSHLLEAYVPGTDPKNRKNVLRVRVTNNMNFIVGFEFPARLVQVPDLYECTRRAPRFRGRW